MIAGQVCGKAARDALFLSTLGAGALPVVVVSSALVSIALAFASAPWVTRWGPRRVAITASLASAASFGGIAFLASRSPAIAAVLLYLHISAAGSLLISWFWSVVNERFDPRTAKRRVGWIAGGGAAGGFAGGLLAERFASASLPIVSLLPALAALHVASATVLAWVGERTTPEERQTDVPANETSWLSGMRALRSNGYLQNLAAFVFVITTAAALVDFVFKSQVSTRLSDGETLLQFFAVFYAVTGLVTLLVQWILSRKLLETAGIARTAALLPGAVGVGGLFLLVPGVLGVAGATALRGIESVLRSSVFRSSYELLYTPVAAAEKRAAKGLVDVGFERLGDASGAAIVQALLSASLVLTSARNASGTVLGILLALAAVLSAIGLVIAGRLRRGYVATLERSLLEQATPSGLAMNTDVTTRTIVLRSLSRARPGMTAEFPHAAPTPATRQVHADVEHMQALTCGDAERVRSAISALTRPVDRALVPALLRLLGWDVVANDVIAALRSEADALAEPLLAALLDPDEEFVVRRRIPRILAAAAGEPVKDGLLRALRDPRFEVRYQCARALSRMRKVNPALRFDREAVFDILAREAAVDRRVWESHRLLDAAEPVDEVPFVDEVLRRRTTRGLEHLFALLSLVNPKEPLEIAFRGLHTDDDFLKGTALEYLETIVPPRVREHLWPLLDDRRTKRAPARSPGAVLDSLLESHVSIQQNLDALRKERGASVRN